MHADLRAAEPLSVRATIERIPDDTLVPLLAASAVPMETLQERYGPLLELVRVLIGVVPNCDAYLEIWPPAFRTYNLLVPNFLDLPSGIFGVGDAPKDLVGLGMYVASRAAECPYCSAHTCSFALRRGAILETVAKALEPDGAARFTLRERATIAVARSLGRVPCEMVDAEREALEAQFTQAEAAWIVCGVGMMGFLNKFMDVVGVELEAVTVAETARTMGVDWDAGKADSDLPERLNAAPPPKRDTLWTKLAVIPKLPTALKLDTRWQRGVPRGWPDVGEFLTGLCGHDFPVLSRLPHDRVVRAIASILRENLDPKTTQVGLDVKVLAGAIFCAVVQDDSLARDVEALAARQGITPEQMAAARAFAVDLDPEAAAPGDGPIARAALRLARAGSPSPARITPAVVAECREVRLSPEAIIEVVTWLAVLQMLHRLTCYYAPA